MKIVATGSYLPKRVVTNDDLSQIMDTSDEWISSRTGIRERHLAVEETTASMSAEAAKIALQQAGMSPEEIDLIIVATITGDYVTPSTACRVQALIGASNAVAFDVNAACSGFLFALHTASAFFEAGIYKKALIIGAETLSKIMNWDDRGTCVLFGDGAGAAIVTSEGQNKAYFDLGSDGAKGLVLACKNRENNNPYVTNSKELDYVAMDGQEVYKFAVSTVPKSIEKVLEQSGKAADDVTLYVLHQANLRILQSVAKRLKVSIDKFPISLDHCGNISAGSVPILLDELNQKGALHEGDTIVMSGFGAGLTWGTVLLTW